MITIGKFGRPHGILGWLRVISFTEPLENIFQYQQWFIQTGEQWQLLPYQDYEIHPHQFLVKLVDCDTPEQAHKYTNKSIAIPREQLPNLPEDEYYWSDLEGLTVINTQGITLGKVDHLLATGANDVIVVKGEKEILIPYINSVLRKIDLTQGRILVDWDLD